jgi:hypothetical protein
MSASEGHQRTPDELAHTPPKAYSTYIDGSIAVSPSPGPGLGPSSIYLGVFDPDFQDAVTQHQEDPIFRRDGFFFHDHRQTTDHSFLVYGDIMKYEYCTSFIGVEAHLYGAVSVYFREYTKAATIDELVGWWILRAWWMALEVHWILGTVGDGHLAVLFNPSNLSDIPAPKSARVQSEYGPFPLTNYAPPRSWGWGAARSNESSKAKKFVKTKIASIRAEVLRELIGDNVRADVTWTSSEVEERLGRGRALEPDKDSRRRARRIPWPGRRAGGRE